MGFDWSKSIGDKVDDWSRKMMGAPGIMSGYAEGGMPLALPAPASGIPGAGGTIPGPVNLATGDDTMTPTKRGEYIWPVEAVMALGRTCVKGEISDEDALALGKLKLDADVTKLKAAGGDSTPVRNAGPVGLPQPGFAEGGAVGSNYPVAGSGFPVAGADFPVAGAGFPVAGLPAPTPAPVRGYAEGGAVGVETPLTDAFNATPSGIQPMPPRLADPQPGYPATAKMPIGEARRPMPVRPVSPSFPLAMAPADAGPTPLTDAFNGMGAAGAATPTVQPKVNGVSGIASPPAHRPPSVEAPDDMPDSSYDLTGLQRDAKRGSADGILDHLVAQRDASGQSSAPVSGVQAAPLAAPSDFASHLVAVTHGNTSWDLSPEQQTAMATANFNADQANYKSGIEQQAPLINANANKMVAETGKAKGEMENSLAPGIAGSRSGLENAQATDALSQAKLRDFQATVEGARATHSGAGNIATMDDQTKKDLAAKYAITGVLPPMGRGAAGEVNRTAILAEWSKSIHATGGTVEEQTARQSALKASQGELASLQKQRGSVMTFANTAIKNFDMVDQLSQSVGRSGTPLLNNWILKGKRSIAGDVDTVKFDAVVQTAIAEYARVMSSATGGGVTSDSARKEVQEMLNTAQTPEQVTGVLKTLRQEIGNRKSSYDESINQIRSAIAGGAEPAAPSPSGLQSPSAQPQQQYWKQPGTNSVKMESVNYLRNNPSPAVRADFDKMYGPGYAALALKG